MLSMSIYSERNINISGKIIQVGEDAFPFVNRSGMFVADGLGGGGGIRVIKFDADCLDAKKLPMKLGSPFLIDQYNESVRDSFYDYVRSNFYSLTDYTMKEIYAEPQKFSQWLKMSGYVGSHALGTALVAELLLLEDLKRRKGFDKDTWNKEVKGIADRLTARYRSIIHILGARCKRTALNKVDYFGTTLSAAFFWDEQTSVDVEFLNCGDSRCYVWDKNGFRQAVDDQGRNGGMTSLFRLTEKMEDNGIRILRALRTYNTPCVIYCMTDGIYNRFIGEFGFHSSPLAMEGFFLKILSDSNSLEEAERNITKQFERHGLIDDSSSMAVAVFGIKRYDGLKAFASERLSVLNKKYELDATDIPDDFMGANYAKRIADSCESTELAYINRLYRPSNDIRNYHAIPKLSIPKGCKSFEERDNNFRLLKKQQEIFADYLKDYLRDVSEDQRQYVMKNGWI